MNKLGVIAGISFLIVGVGFIMNSGFGVGISKTQSDQINLSPENNTKNNSISEEELKEKLTPLQYKVTQENGTEAPFTEGNYEDNKEPGIYVDIVDGTPLYSSLHKYDSGTGWPSFWQGIDDNMLVYKEDNSLFSKRIEVRSKIADSHLGHIFPDGPADQGGQRHCINGASLRFIPLTDLESEGYGKYAKAFET